MYDLAHFSLGDMTECSAALRKLGIGATSMDEVAERIVRYLYAHLEDRQTHEKNCAQVRFFKTQAYGDLDRDCQRFACEALGRVPHSPALKCLTLTATAGQLPEWNDRSTSRQYRAIPLVGEPFVAQFPMFSQLLKQFGVKLSTNSETDSDLLIDGEATPYNVFYVPEALKSSFVSVQEEFVIPYGIRSVLGFGGLLPSGNLFAVILFSKVHISSATADLFRMLALSAKLAVLPCDDTVVFGMTVGLSAEKTAVSELPLPEPEPRSNQSQAETLEQLLTVHEQALMSHVIERKRAEEALQKSEHRVRSLVENARDVIITLSKEGRIASLNPAFETLTRWTRAEWIGQRFSALLHPDDAPEATEVIQHILEKEASVTYCMRVRSKSGGFIMSEFVGTPQIADGQVVGVLGIARDITERKIIEEALRDSEERLRSIVQSTKDAILSIDSEGRLALWNNGAEAMFGYSADEVIGRPVTIIIPERFRLAHRQGVARATAAGRLTVDGNMFELVGLRKDGTEFPVEFSVASWAAKSGQFFTGILRDITERKRAEARLRNLYETTSAPYPSFADKLSGLLKMGCKEFNLEVGLLTRIRGEHFEIVEACSPNMAITKGMTLPVEHTCCSQTLRSNEPLGFEHAGASEKWRAHPFYAAFRLEAYLGTAIRVGSEAYGTLCFVSPTPRSCLFTAADKELLRLMAQWVTGELERRQAEEALQETKQRFRGAFDYAASGMALVATDGRFLQVNQSLCKIVGYSEQELLATTFQVITHPDDLEADLAYLHRMLIGEIQTFQTEKRYLHKHGHIVWALLSVALVHNPQGKPSYCISQIQDITERKRAEQELTEKTRLLQSVLDSVADGVVVADETGEFLLWNPAANQIVGAAATKIDPQQRSAQYGLFLPDTVTLYPPDNLPLARAIRGESVNDVLVFIRHTARPDGVWLSVNARPLRDETGRLRGGVAAFRDITEHERAEELLRRGAERFHKQESAFVRLTHSKGVRSLNLAMRLRHITESTAHALGVERVSIWRYTSDRQAIQCVDLYGLSANRHSSGYELRAASYPSYFDALAINQVIAADDAHHDARTCEFAEGYLSALGISSMMDVPIYQFGKLEGVICCEHIGVTRHWTQDEQMFAVAMSNLISLAYEEWERKQAEEALRKHEEFSYRMIDSSQDCITVLDLQGRLLWMNEWGQRLLALSEFESVRNSQWIELWKGRDREAASAAVASAKAGSVGTFQGCCPTASGNPKWWDVIITPILDVRGRPERLLSVCRDISERKQAQEEVHRTLDSVRTLSRRLDVVREEERARIARELHDELGTGLTCLKIDLSRLLTVKGETGDWKGRRRADKEISSMVEFVDATISSVQRIVSELRPAVLDDLGLVAAIEWQAQDFESRTGVTCICSFSQEDVKVEAERTTVIFRICQEALTNVARHAGATAVAVRLEEQDRTIVLKVCDNGRGISIDKLSDPRSFGLLGMRERAVLLGGEVTISGRPNEGTTVTLHLPNPKAS